MIYTLLCCLNFSELLYIGTVPAAKYMKRRIKVVLLYYSWLSLQVLSRNFIQQYKTFQFQLDCILKYCVSAHSKIWAINWKSRMKFRSDSTNFQEKFVMILAFICIPNSKFLYLIPNSVRKYWNYDNYKFEKCFYFNLYTGCFRMRCEEFTMWQNLPIQEKNAQFSRSRRLKEMNILNF